MMVRVLRAVAAVTVVVGATLVAPATTAAGGTSTVAGAYAFAVTSPSVLTGPSPFSACAIGAVAGSVAYPNAEVEPWLDVDPTSGNAVAVWQQDRWSDGGARALGTTTSADGTTWERPRFVPWSLCAGGGPPAGDFPRVSDPWVSFGPDGIGYQVALGLNQQFPFNESAITASRSLDGGRSWQAPTVILREPLVAAPFPMNDKETVTADPSRPGRAYVVWSRIRFPSQQEALQGASSSFFEARSFRADAMLSRTLDGGASWEPARSIMPTNANLATIDNQVAVTGDGTLVDLFKGGQGPGDQPADLTFIGALRSTDAGHSWSRVRKLADAPSVQVRDPDDGEPVRALTNLDVAADVTRPGTLYAVWSDGRFSGGIRNDIVFTRSTDGGLTWSPPNRINQTPPTANPLDGQAFLPSIAVSSDGTIGMFYYDFRFNTPDPATLPTTAFLVHSHDGGRSWIEDQLATPFDLQTAPVTPAGLFIGDYQGLAASGRDFVTVFAVTNGGEGGNRTDIVSVRADALAP
jgi:hypothetical protein